MNGPALATAVALLVANAFFVWAEFALVAARATRMQQLAEAGSRRARLTLVSMGDLNFALAGAQLGITMASLGLGFVAEPAVGDLLAGPLRGLPEALARPVEISLALTIVVAAHMVIGEMVPKNIAIAEPDRSALLVVAPFRAYALVFRPVIWFLNVVSNAVVWPFGVRPRDRLSSAHSAEEIRAMLEASGAEGVIDPFEQRLLARILVLRDLDAGAAMVPRPDVVAVPDTATPAEIGRLVVETGHSRLPVYRDTLDDVAGFVHAKDLLGVAADDWERPIPSGLVRDALVVPESRSLLHALNDMREHRAHLAVVVDEHGGVEGVLTLEDVLEELVGDIRDEYDRREGDLWRLGPGRMLVDGGLRRDELDELVGLELPDGDYDTVGGFVMARLGHVPITGDEVGEAGWRIRVRRMEGRRVDLVELVEPQASESSAEDDHP